MRAKIKHWQLNFQNWLTAGELQELQDNHNTTFLLKSLQGTHSDLLSRSQILQEKHTLTQMHFYSFAANTMAADANQLLKELWDFLRVGDDNLARRFI